jgi:hypothetical protein
MPPSAFERAEPRAVGGIVRGDEAQTQAVIDAGALQRFLNSAKPETWKEACWMISKYKYKYKVYF